MISESGEILITQLFHQPTLMHNFLYSLTICLLGITSLFRALLLQYCLNNTVELILI